MTDSCYVEYTRFNSTRKVFAMVHNSELPGDIEHILWVERPEDEYALLSPKYKNRKVAVVRKEHWEGALVIT